MDAAIRDYGLEAEKSSYQTRADLIPSETSPSLKYPHFFVKGGLTRWLSVVVSASSVATGGITDFDKITKQLQRDQLSSAREMNPSLQEQQIVKQTAPVRKPIWERIQDAFSHVSDEELAAWPVDGAAQVDHYLYGTPKR